MRELYLETATAACAAMLVEDGRVLAAREEAVGRGHAERLVPMIAELPNGGRAGRIVVDVGPGSFTGIRVGIAAALGLGLGWSAEVCGFSSLAAVARGAFAVQPALARLAVVAEGGHGELFMQVFDAEPFYAAGALASLKPAEALAALGALPAVGSGLRWLPELPDERRLGEALPRLSDALTLPPELRMLPPRPLYGRGADAKPMAPRA
jgi:tRNA threonylcarbamoyladenosine biosynthesis protein TsaB